MPDGNTQTAIGNLYVPPAQGIGKLAKALAAAQGAIKGAEKDRVNPHFKSQYADLTAVWDACRDALAKNEIAVIQATSFMGDGRVVLNTILAHSSGEQVTGHFPVTPVQNTPQGLGSALTYARRYSLASMVGVAPAGEDDDGNAGSQGATIDKSPPAQVKNRSGVAQQVERHAVNVDAAGSSPATRTTALPPDPKPAVAAAVTKWVDEQIKALGEITSMDSLLAWENEADDKGESNLRKMDRITGSVYPLQGNRLKSEYLRLATELNPANG